MKLLPAIILNAVLFALIHFPVWIYLRHDIATFVSGSISIMGLSALFAFSFVRTKNIIVPMALHMIWNLLVAVFFGDS
jgi:membrane protease YdiL (CAAX protease family)